MDVRARSALAATLLVSAATHSYESIVPFDTPRGTLIVARGALGRLDGRPLLVDTGTSRTVVDQRITRRLDLRGTEDTLEAFGRRLAAERVAMPTLRLGTISVVELSVLSVDLSEPGRRLGARFDAIVGFDVLRGHCFIVDYETRRLTFGNPGCPALGRARVWSDPNAPSFVAGCTVDGHRYRLLVDTGTDALALFEGAATRYPAAPQNERVMGDSILRAVQLRGFMADSVRIGETEIGPQRVVVVPGDAPSRAYDGIIGASRLGMRVQLDLSRMVIGWDR